MTSGETKAPRQPEPRREPLQAPGSYPFPTGPEEMLPWAPALERLATARNYWLATTRPDGRPHAIRDPGRHTRLGIPGESG